MTFACQNMEEDELHPPQGRKPGSEVYLAFLRARRRVNPGADPWVCPRVALYRTDIELVDTRAEVKKAFRARYSDPLMSDALMLYWDGVAGEAVARLQHLRETREKAALHARADELRRDVSAVESLYKSGGSALRDKDFRRAAGAFRQVLAVDGRLMNELAGSRPSFFRRSVQQDMAREAYAGGRLWADRQDFRRGCGIWKLGFGFYRGNADLNRAVSFCSSRGSTALEEAKSCSDLEHVLDYAVEGDGLERRVMSRRAELRCR
jgi:hypothetical protein